MMIAVVNGKGGVGKSTIAAHLAAWLHEQGYSVILADCDTQQSSSEWIREAAPEVQAVHFDNPETIYKQLPTLLNEADFVIGDGPGSQTEATRALLLKADLAVFPCKASMLEVRALAECTAVLKVAHDIRKGLPPAVIVLSMVRQNHLLTRDMKAAAEALHLPVAHTAMILRQFYADAPGQKTFVWRMPRAQKAGAEIDRLFRELLPDVARSAPRRSSTTNKSTRKAG